MANLADDLKISVDTLRVATGTWWETDSKGVDLDVDDQSFELPRTVRLASVYADLNANSRLDRFAEPRSRCALTAKGWNCRLKRFSLTVKSITRHNLAAGSLDTRLLVVAEAFLPNGDIDLTARLCQHSGDCAPRTKGPYAAAGEALILQLCDFAKPGLLETEVIFAGADWPAVALHVRKPPLLNVSVRTELRLETFAIFIATAGRQIDRALIVVRQPGRQAPVWTSEQDTSRLQPDGEGGMLVTVPLEILERCTTELPCQIVGQVAADLEGPVDATSQYEFIAEFPQP